jgi:hypothetical protein
MPFEDSEQRRRLEPHEAICSHFSRSNPLCNLLRSQRLELSHLLALRFDNLR